MIIEKENYSSYLNKINFEKLVYFSVLIFLAILYFSNRNIATKFYYITSSLVFIYIFFIDKNINNIFKNKIFLCTFLIIFYSAISSVFINGLEYAHIKSSVRVLLFLAALIVFFRNEKDINFILKIILIFTFLGSFPDLYDYFSSGRYQKAIRFGLGKKYLVNIYAGGIYSISAIISMYLVLNDKFLLKKVIYSFSFVYLSGLVYLSQSRAAIISYLLSIVLYLILSRRINYKYLLITLTAFSFLFWFINSWVFKFTSFLTRKDSGRFEIWDKSLDMITDKLIFGHGLGADFQLYILNGRILITEPHNLYLYALFTGGLVCLVLLLFLYWTAIVTIYRNWNYETGPFLSAMLLFIVMFNFFDSRKIVDDIGVGWHLFWVPVGIIAAYSAVLKARKNNQASVVDTTKPLT